LLRTIKTNYPELDPEAINLKLPLWRAVPQTDYEQALKY